MDIAYFITEILFPVSVSAGFVSSIFINHSRAEEINELRREIDEMREEVNTLVSVVYDMQNYRDDNEK